MPSAYHAPGTHVLAQDKTWMAATTRRWRTKFAFRIRRRWNWAAGWHRTISARSGKHNRPG